MFKLILLPKVKRMLQSNICFKEIMKFAPCNCIGPCIATYETLWKTSTNLCKSPWQVHGLLIIFSASGFSVKIKFQPAACNLQPAKHTCRVHTCCISTRKMTYASAISFRMKPWEYVTRHAFQMAEDEIPLLLLLLCRCQILFYPQHSYHGCVYFWDLFFICN